MPPTPENRVHVVYGSALLTPVGRVADSSILRALGWEIGMPIDIQPALPGVVTITTVTEAKHAMTSNGQLPIPVAVRRRVGRESGTGSCWRPIHIRTGSLSSARLPWTD